MKKKIIPNKPQDKILEGGSKGGGFQVSWGGKSSPAKKVRTATTTAAVASKAKDAKDEWDLLNE